MIKTITDNEGFLALESMWNSLGAQTELLIFQTFEWCRAAWFDFLDNGENKLYVMVWNQENRDDVVIFPMYLDRLGYLRFIMDEHSDVCDCVYIPGVNHHLAFKEAAEVVCADRSINRVLLYKLLGDSEILNYWGTLLPNSRLNRFNTCSFIRVNMADDFAVSQSQLRSKDKANVRAILRRAGRYELIIRSKKRGDEFPYEDIQALRQSMIAAKRRSNDFLAPRALEFCRSVYEKMPCEIVELLDEAQRPIALNLLLLMGERRLSWLFLYADQHASTEMYVKYLYQECTKGEFVFDFGAGGYTYKFGTFRPELRCLMSLIFDNNSSMRRRTAVHTLKAGIENVLRMLGK